MKLKFNVNGNIKQMQLAKAWLNDGISEIVYGGAKGGGKSFAGVNLIFGDAFIYPNTMYFIARKKLNDLTRFTRPSIHEVFGIWGINETMYSFNGKDNFYELNNKSRVYLLDAKYLPSDPLYKRFGSMQMTRGWIEEAGEFESASKSNLSASIGRWKNDVYKLKGKLLMTCNPSQNFLFKDFYKKYRKDELESWKTFIQALPSDNKKLPDGYIEHLERTLSESERKRLLQGLWEYDSSPNSLIDYDSAMDIFSNDFVERGERRMTCDIALKGSDLMVIAVWSGWRCERLIWCPKLDSKELENLIRAIATQEAIPRSKTVIDADGIGSYLEGYLKGLKSFRATAPQVKMEGDRNFHNINAQVQWRTAKRVVNREVYINPDGIQMYDAESKVFTKSGTDKVIEMICDECLQIKHMEMNDERKVRIVPKAEMKMNLGRSPDFWDAMKMNEVFELKVKTKSQFIS